MVKSPFPGMDPYLEQDWLDVHTRLVTYICDQIQDRLPSDLCARMESRVLVEGEEGDTEPRARHPDVRLVESSATGGTAVLDQPNAATAEPDMFLVEARPEPATQRYIQIIDVQTGGRVVTSIELISPSNKRPGPGQQLYLAKQEECLNAGVNLVEIDLTRGGNRLSILSPLWRLDRPPTYIGCVRRAKDPERWAVYLMPLDQPLKPMRIPLRANDEDVILELQPLVEQAYQRGRYGNLNYQRPLDPPLAKDEAEIAERMLKAAGKR
jgi:hypothetical protein